jgi:transcriptional regulator with XRE-family HTH domain
MISNDELDNYSESVLNLVSKNVKKYRRKKGLTQMNLAMEIGMTGGAYLGRAENRKDLQHFNISHLAKISKVLQVDIKDFFKV